MCCIITRSNSITTRYIYRYNYYIESSYNIKLPSREGYLLNIRMYIKSESLLEGYYI